MFILRIECDSMAAIRAPADASYAAPTAIHVASLEAVERQLLPALRELAEAFEGKASEFADVVKAGRTHLQDAVPVTLGQEFSGYASVIRHGLRRVENCRPHVAELPL